MQQPTHTAPCDSYTSPRRLRLRFSADAPTTGCQVVEPHSAGRDDVEWVACGQPPFGLATGWDEAPHSLVACFHHLVALDGKVPVLPLPVARPEGERVTVV